MDSSHHRCHTISHHFSRLLQGAPFFFGYSRSRSEAFFPFNAFKAFVRSFHKFILPEINCEKHAMLSIEEAAKESECGPLQVHIVVQVRKPHKSKTKQNQNTTHKNQPKRNTTKNQLDGNMLLMN